jgi:hypothetical protein
LVWLAERFAQFPDFFFDCEEMLFVLAKHECEPNIGNNATKIWQQFFRMQLAGTAVPFTTRLDLLRQRLEGADAATAELLAGAIDKVLDMNESRMLGPPVVGGIMPPPDWQPANWSEVRDAIREGLPFIEQATHSSVAILARRAKATLISDLEVFARQGWIDELRPIVEPSSLDENERARLVGKLKHFVRWHKDPGGAELPSEYVSKLEEWIRELEPKTYHARLVELVGGHSWDHYGRENEWQRELNRLAWEMLGDANLFAFEGEWLTSSEASSAFEFGHALGTLNPEATKIARHIPQPHVDAEGKPVIPELTEYVLTRFEDDDRTFAEFCAGAHSLQMYTGDIASAREGEAERARAFFDHPLRRIREWAGIEYESGMADAQRHREWGDETGF